MDFSSPDFAPSVFSYSNQCEIKTKAMQNLRSKYCSFCVLPYLVANWDHIACIKMQRMNVTSFFIIR